jgi:5-dehydro-4-deoxyglucarate dehydratase
VLVCSEPSHLASLTMREYAGLVDVAVDVAQGTAPVVVGIGHARTTAAEFAQTAVLCGADAGPLMLPEPGGSPAESLVGHVRRVSSATTLPLLVRQGTAAVARATSWVPQLGDVSTVIGLQDCSGELGQAQAVRLAAPYEWVFLQGCVAAELHARPYASIGFPAYASAVHAYAPEIARSFYRGLQEGDDDWVEELLREFFLPLADLTSLGSDYATCLPRAAARLRGASMGHMRSPLAEVAPEHLRVLDALLERGLRLVSPDA